LFVNPFPSHASHINVNEEVVEIQLEGEVVLGGFQRRQVPHHLSEVVTTAQAERNTQGFNHKN
jgi:hypothetical protein